MRAANEPYALKMNIIVILYLRETTNHINRRCRLTFRFLVEWGEGGGGRGEGEGGGERGLLIKPVL